MSPKGALVPAIVAVAIVVVLLWLYLGLLHPQRRERGGWLPNNSGNLAMFAAIPSRLVAVSGLAIRKLLPGAVRHDKARDVVFLDSPRRRKAAGGHCSSGT
jgi:hypothetical protein